MIRFSERISVQREKYVPGVVFKIYNGHIQRRIAPSQIALKIHFLTKIWLKMAFKLYFQGISVKMSQF